MGVVAPFLGDLPDFELPMIRYRHQAGGDIRSHGATIIEAAEVARANAEEIWRLLRATKTKKKGK